MPTIPPVTASTTWLGSPRLLALAEAVESETGVWTEIVRSGEFFGAESWGDMVRRVSITAEDIDAMVGTWATVEEEGWFTGGVAVTCNHGGLWSSNPDDGAAQGRILAVEARDNDAGGRSLWGRIAWTDEGARRLRDGEYAAISAEIVPAESATSKVTGKRLGGPVLIGATLCNNPMIPGMAPPSAEPMAASDRPCLLALSETRPMPTPAAPTIPTGMLLLAESEVLTLRESAAKVAALTEALSTVTADRHALTAETKRLAESLWVRRLDDACSQGRIAAAERDRYRKAFEALGETEADAIFVAGRIPVLPLGVSGHEPVADPVLAMTERAKAEAAKTGEHPARVLARLQDSAPASRSATV